MYLKVKKKMKSLFFCCVYFSFQFPTPTPEESLLSPAAFHEFIGFVIKANEESKKSLLYCISGRVSL